MVLSTLFALVLLVGSSFASDDLVALVNKGNTDALLQQVGHGVLADEPNSKGQIALVAAVKKGDMKAADILLNYRASPSTVEPSSGATGITAAFSAGNAAMSKLLMKFGGSPDAQEKSGKTARTLAKKNKELQELIRRFDDAGAEAFEEEPGTWEKHMYEDRGLPYYHNRQTEVTQYSIPISCAWVKGHIDGSTVYTNSITHQTRWTTPRALAWKYLHNAETNSYYWFNYVTQSTSHTVPAELPADMVADLQFDSGAFYYANSATQATQWADPAEEDWRQLTDPDGNKFWFHPKTLETTWERPASHAWQAASSPDHDGHMYYVNDVTREATWDKPEPMAWEKQIFTHGMADSL